MYGAGAAYNQGMNERERARSREKSYPHMFPNPGTTMHWFLTTRWVHVSITMAVLLTLAFTSMISTWSQTSPYAHLIPPLNMLFFSPLTYLSEVWSVYRLHLEYTTAQTAEHRRQGILDAQKRRLYRRAHGMEDLEADEVSGVDVKGLVEWDDGLTNRERERGGVYNSEMIGRQMQEMGQRPGESLNELMERKRVEQIEGVKRREEEKVRKKEEAARAEEERLVRIGARRPEEQERPRRKVYFGIWG
ncbi:hypothetical protein PMZ80_003894 [Knufia obscura]|nr:hypothetical protein PMZ80_003894 [Knufia obscura]